MILEHRFAHIPQDGRRDRAWLASLAPLYAGHLRADAVVPPGAFLRHHHLGEIILTVDDSPAQVLERDTERVLAQGLDHLVLWTPAGGCARVTAPGTDAAIEPGAILLLELSQPFRIVMEPLSGHAIVVPRRLIEAGAEPPDWHGQVLSGPQAKLGAMLADHMRHAGGCLSDLSLAQARHLAPATLSLCRALLAGFLPVDRDLGSPRSVALGLAVRRYIECHLASVDAAMLMAEFGLSRTILYELFSDAGGLYAYIRDRRLAEAKRRLSRTDGEHRPMMAQLAHACGFNHPIVFARAFRRKYGINPSEVTPARMPVAIPGGNGNAALIAWLRDL
ncbi:AraC family transcriptional regulator [Methylobacterium sp. WL6]|uniref:helix-turn-helix transcriptional regulator n=1 Tax=Methylobacterium sp. WL6 TaxID=2603901 RepID=UPI0011C7B810|nr:AraC family transcriptional regulator [Methylobacterium sp. WL6]TXN72323.1 AraC family transcriptional regulator [Methylobacterium sp. WL6]